MISCISTLRQFAIRPLAIHPVQLLHTTPVNAAARKGTREKARKKKVKVEIQKIGFIPHNQRGRDKYASLTTPSIFVLPSSQSFQNEFATQRQTHGRQLEIAVERQCMDWPVSQMACIHGAGSY